jgi:putative hydrolase of the HAD superfamily
LDNTLYSSRYGLEDNVGRRIREFTAAYLGLAPDEAWRLRLANSHRYGTCLEWLMAEKGLTDTETYLAAIHPEGVADALVPDPELRAFLAGLQVPKAILTNSTREHAKLILCKLGVGDLFTHIFDIRMSNFIGKPQPQVFNRALEILGVKAEEVLFIDDSPHYAESFINMGGNSILFDENDIHKNYTLPKITKLGQLARFLN